MYLTLHTKEYQHNVYLITKPELLSPIDDEVLVQVVDGGNTLTNYNGDILGHYVGTH